MFRNGVNLHRAVVELYNLNTFLHNYHEEYISLIYSLTHLLKCKLC